MCRTRRVYGRTGSKRRRSARGAIGGLGERFDGGLNVGVANRIALADLDGLHLERRVARQTVRDGSTNSDVDRLAIDIVLEGDDTSGEVQGLVKRRIEGLLVRDSLDLAAVDTPVVGIPLLNDAVTIVVRDRSPEGGNEVHRFGNGTDTVVDVTVGRPEEDGGHAGDVLDRLASPTQLGDNLLVGQGSEGGMGPGVDT